MPTPSPVAIVLGTIAVMVLLVASRRAPLAIVALGATLDLHAFALLTVDGAEVIVAPRARLIGRTVYPGMVRDRQAAGSATAGGSGCRSSYGFSWSPRCWSLSSGILEVAIVRPATAMRGDQP